MLAIIVLAVVAALTVLGTVVLVAVAVAIHSEPHNQMATKAHRPLAAIVRRMLGVYVSKPADAADNDNREECLTGQSTDWWNKPGGDR
jgi:hypothetical protein